MNEMHQTSLDFFTSPETPQERGERLANEMLAEAEKRRAENPADVEYASEDNREMYLPSVSVEPVDESPDKNNLGESNDTPNPELDNPDVEYEKRIIEHVNPATQDPGLRDELRRAENILRTHGL
jgi:hypothetical protein